MCEYGFMEGLDYTKIYQKKEGSRTGQIEVDYEISMDMAGNKSASPLSELKWLAHF